MADRHKSGIDYGEDTDKTYFSGSDASVGFGVPADYAGGEGPPDKVIERHNEQAKRIKKFVPRIYSSALERLRGVERTTLTREAEKYLETYNNLKEKIAVADQLLEDVQDAVNDAQDTITQVERNFSKDEYENEEELYSDLREFTDSPDLRSLEKDLRNKLYIDEPLQNTFGFFDTLGMISVKDGDWPGKFEYAYDNFDPLDDTKEVQGAVDRLRGQFVIYEDELSRLQRDMHSRLIELERTGEIDSSKSFNRLLDVAQSEEETRAANDSDTVPKIVPNYRVALDSSPRVCGNCRFFQGTEGVNGHCRAFDFTAKAHYVCDAWQAQQLTAYHTVVRNEGDDEDTSKQGDVEYSSPMLEGDHVDKDEGKVEGHYIEHTANEGGDLQIAHTVDYSEPSTPDENAALRAAGRSYIPGDKVYSNALRTLAIVDDVAQIDGVQVYGLKLVDNRGGVWGAGYSYARDLEPRSNEAVKNDPSVKAYEDEFYEDIRDDGESINLDQIITATRKVYKMTSQAVRQHEDFVSNPVSNKDTLNPIRDALLALNQSPMMKNVKTGPRRKYYRALQHALSSIGAARQILWESYRAINETGRTDGAPATQSMIRKAAYRAQKDAYSRLVNANDHLKDALSLPSATHGYDAPGFEEDFNE